MERETAIEELQRVAALLQAKFLSRSMFGKHATISAATVEATFGSWTEAIIAAGLVPLPQGGMPKAEQRRLERLTKRQADPSSQRIPDDDLLDELIRVAKDLGRRPSGNQINAKGKFSGDVYKKRWGSVARAYDVAVARSNPREQ